MEELVKELLNTPACCKELKEKAQKYLDNQTEETKNELIEEIKEDINPIDGFIGFLNTDMAVQFFGKEGTEERLKEAIEAKEKGEEYCTCPACQICKKILSM